MQADICLIAEGCYPYVRGGVSSWIHNLIISQPQHSFHIVEIVPADMKLNRYYEFPPNVVGSTTIPIRISSGKKTKKIKGFNYKKLKEHINVLFEGRANLKDFKELIELISSNPSFADLLESREIWEEMIKLYRNTMPESSFLNYFWSMRAILGGLYSILLAPLPKAKVYHATCTGYAGLYAARAKIETSNPVILTEHGIYTNERRIEISASDWLHNYQSSLNFTVDFIKRELKDLWTDSFACYSRICYQACNSIVTLYDGNQKMQIEDGADRKLLKIIPNGIEVKQFARIAERDTTGTGNIGFIGRVVPVKDVKSFIRVAKELQQINPLMKAYIIGPFDEDPDYYNECLELMRYLALEDTIIFTGQADIHQHLYNIDVVVLTSISESQPLVVLEAGAAAIPVVSTDVGACREIILGRKNENPPLGAGGYITPPSDTTSMVKVIARLLKEHKKRKDYGRNLHNRVSQYYDKNLQDNAYKKLYAEMISWQA